MSQSRNLTEVTAELNKKLQALTQQTRGGVENISQFDVRKCAELLINNIVNLYSPPNNYGPEKVSPQAKEIDFKKIVRDIFKKQKNPEFVAQTLLDLLNDTDPTKELTKSRNPGTVEVINKLKTAILVERDFNIKQKISLKKQARYHSTRLLGSLMYPTSSHTIITVNGVKLLLGRMPTDIEQVTAKNIKHIVGAVQASEYPLLKRLDHFFRQLRNNDIKHDQIENHLQHRFSMVFHAAMTSRTIKKACPD